MVKSATLRMHFTFSILYRNRRPEGTLWDHEPRLGHEVAGGPPAEEVKPEGHPIILLSTPKLISTNTNA